MAIHDRRRFLTLVTPYVPLLMCACSREHGLPKKPNALRVSIFPSLTNGGLYLAQEKGLFTAEGIEVKFLPFKNTSQTVPLLASAQLDAVAGGLSSALLNAVIRGSLIRIVATIVEANTACGNGGALYTRTGEYEPGLAGIRKMAGRRIAISGMGGLGEFFLDVLLRESGLTSKDFTLLQLPQAEGIAALLGRHVDAIVYAQLDKEVASLSGIMKPIRQVDEAVPHLQFSFIIFGPKLLQGDTETGKKLIRAILHGNRRYLEGETPRHLREFIESSRTNLNLALSGCREGITKTGRINPDHIQYFIDWAVAKGYCPKPLRAAALIDNRFLSR
jgi:predicted outer membrane repeat protein